MITPELGSTAWDSAAVGFPMVLAVGSEYYVYYTAFSGAYYSLGLAIIPSSQLQVSSTTEAHPAYTTTTQVSTTPVPVTSATSSLHMPQPPQPRATQSTNYTTPLLALAVIAAVVIGAAFLHTKRKGQPKFTEAERIEPKTEKPTSSKSFCIECGNELPSKSKFCNNCGTRQP